MATFRTSDTNQSSKTCPIKSKKNGKAFPFKFFLLTYMITVLVKPYVTTVMAQIKAKTHLQMLNLGREVR